MRSVLHKFILMLSISILLSACAGGDQGGLEISGAWARAAGEAEQQSETMNPEAGHMGASGGEMMAGMNSAAYMVIKNNTGQVDRLLRVESDAAQAVELHKSEIVNDMMTMRPVENIEVPAGGQANLEPGGLHVMLIGLKQPLVAGNRIALTLVFEKAGNIEVEAEIRAP